MCLAEFFRKYKVTFHEMDEWVERSINGEKTAHKAKPQTSEKYEFTQIVRTVRDQQSPFIF